ncbi:SusC/RagA family TonB-linked outer membrane protein [Seonamhaeicola sp. NFXS20]|uniref:SusC/RagA family TonB-linked outer membrane protein n=1 Tax=Seonamhaeicola sp. NFXS20 TaxID=2816959 RepID=UPI003B9DE3F7
MKTFIFLLCSTVFSFSPVNVLSQNVKVKIPEDKTITVDQVFDMIKQQTDYRFIYRSDMFRNYPKVDVKKGVVRANKLLEKSLAKGNFKFIISANNTITIRQASAVQELEVSGTVTDENGLPIPGITVYVSSREPGSGLINSDFVIRGTATDIDGKFTIKAEAGYYLIASGLGYELFKTQITTSQTTFNITLKEALSELDEVVVVSSGYQEISKERATGAYVGVKKDQINKPASSISERLIGAVAGVQSTVAADGSISFQIRGLSSLVANAEPLIVLDGFPIEGGFDTINPNDVESITVLKDAAAASIWGAKAANGVIVVETKKGKKGQTNVSISSFVRTSSKLDLDYVLSRASSADVLEYEQTAFDSDFFGSVFGGPPGIGSNFLDPFSQAIVAMNEARLGRITEAERDATLANLASLDNSQQIKDYLLESPLTAQYNINISGGNDRMTNSLSIMYEDKNSMFIGDKTQEYLINFKNQTQLAKRLKLDFGAMLQHSDATINSGGDMLSVIKSLAPWDMLKNEDGTLTDMSYLNYYMPNFNEYVPAESFPYSDWSYNPITEVQNRDLNTKQLNARVNAGLTVDLIEGMKLSSRIQYEMFNTTSKNYYSDKTFAVRQFINETSGPEWQYGGTPTQLVPNGGILEQGKTEVNAYNWRNQLSFNRTFSEKHNISFLAGSEVSHSKLKTTTNPPSFGYDPETLVNSELLVDRNTHSLWNFYPAQYASYFYQFSLAPEYQFSESTTRLFSLYGNLAYTFNDKYTVSGSYRTDAANIIADDPALRYDPFWSAGLGWHLGKESFMANITWLDKLYLRGTYGSGGNIIPSSSFSPLISLSSSLDDVTNQLTASITDVGNPDLRWEKTKSINLGIDFSTLNSKLYGSIDLYKKNGEDLIVDQALSGVYGTTSQRLNNGKMVNKGIELSLGTFIPLKGRDIVWSGTFNFAYNKNEITEFTKAVYGQYELYGGPTTSYREGFDANELWAYEYAGLSDVGGGVMAPTVYGENGVETPITGWASGDARNYMTSQGTTNAPTIIGFRNAFKIYDFDLSFIVTGKFGHVFRRQSFNYNPVISGNTNVNDSYSEVANGDPNEIIPIPSVEARYYFYDRYYPYMSYLTEDASHIRFQEVNLTYNLPKNIINKLGINSLSFFAQANNLGVILFNDFNEDPEYPKGTLRPQTTYTFGMNLNF